MQRIDHVTAVASLPAPLATTAPGFFNRGSSAGGGSTVVTADWCNTMQEELVAFLTAAGIAPDKTNTAQVLAAMAILFPPLTAFGNSLVPLGYQRLPGGLILNWFNTTVPGDSTRRPYFLPVTFPHVGLAVLCSYQAQIPPSAGNIGADFYDNARVGLANTSPAGGSNAVFVLALGY